MSQLILLLKACRKELFRVMVWGVVAPLGLFLLICWFFAAIFGDADRNSLPDTLAWVLEYPFLLTVYSALIAAYATVTVGIPSALGKLPVPLTKRQIGYLPLGISLANWGILQSLLVALILFVSLTTGDGNLWPVLLEVIAALPLGILVFTLVNRGADAVQSSFGFWMPFFYYPLVLSNFGPEQVMLIHYIYEYYLLLSPLLLLVALLMISDLPIHRVNWYRAVFTSIPTGFKTMRLRETVAPQRLQKSNQIVAALYFLCCRVFDLLIVAMLVGMYIGTGSLWTPNSVRVSLETEQLLWALAGTYLLLSAFFFAGKTTLIHLQVGRCTIEHPWAQFVLRVTYFVQKSFLWRHRSQEKMVHRDPISGDFGLRAHYQDGTAYDADASGKVPRKDVGTAMVRALSGQLVVMAFIFGFPANDVDYLREGSNISGDPQAQPDQGYAADAQFSQHYVTLNFGTGLSSAEQNQAFGTLQMAAFSAPAPIAWLAGLETLDGLPAQIPEHYRLEISRPESGRVVIQSIGVRWDPAGVMAYGLAEYLRATLDDSLSVKVDPDYNYYPPFSVFTPSYGYLDNEIHWISGDDAGVIASGHSPPPLATDTPVYVDVRNTDGWENGKTWATAYDTIQEGIAAAYRRRVRSVWVAAGVYGEEGYGDGSLLMLPGIHVYGGFSGDETIRTQRDVPNRPTTIDGSHSKRGDATYHVVIAAGDATLDGFIITGGRANGTAYSDDHGGGMVIEDCWPVIRQCTFIDNKARLGAAVYMSGGGATIEGCRFLNNRAKEYGSVLWNQDKNLSLENCLFAGNACLAESGNAIFAQDFSMKNCTLIGSGYSDNSLFRDGPEASRFINCIMVNPNQPFAESESAISFSLVEGGAPGLGNLDLEPRFVDPENGDYRLRPDSPAIDAGHSEDPSAVDLDGNPRVQGKSVDMGAFEFVPE